MNTIIIMINMTNMIMNNMIVMMIKRRVGSTFQTVRESRIPDRQLFLFNFQEEKRRGLSLNRLNSFDSNQIKSNRKLFEGEKERQSHLKEAERPFTQPIKQL